MIYISLDIETTGLNPERDQILQIAMIAEDSSKHVAIENLPTFVCFVSHPRIEGDPYAIAMNSWIIKEMTGNIPTKQTLYPVYDQEEMLSSAVLWLNQFGEGRLTAAGKNVAGFDLPFLPRDLRARFRHRVIDVGSVMIDWNETTVLSLEELLKTKIDAHARVAHDALEDARDVIRLLRTTYPVKA